MFNNKKATTKNLVLEGKRSFSLSKDQAAAAAGVFTLLFRKEASNSLFWKERDPYRRALELNFRTKQEAAAWLFHKNTYNNPGILRALPTHMGDHTFLIIWLGQAVCGIWKVTWVGWKNGGRKGKGLGRWWDGWWRFLGSMEKRAREGGRAGPRYIFRKKEGKVTAMLKKNAKFLFKRVFVSFFKKLSKPYLLNWFFFAFFDVLVPLPLGARFIFGPLLVLLLVVQTAAVKKKA